MKRYIIALVGIFFAREIFAQELSPIQTDRPDQTETPYTVPSRHFQMETGFSFEHTNDSITTITHPSILFKYGVNDHFELRLITEIERVRSGESVMAGLLPVTFGLKVNLMQEDGIIPITSFIGHLSAPTLASKCQLATYFAPAFRFTMQHSLSDAFSLGYNLGAEWDGESAEPIFIYTLTTAYSLSESIGAYVELYGFAPQNSRADHRLDGGISFLLQNNMLLDISGGVGLTPNAPKYYGAIGFSFRLPD
jgi:hypothetical protein